MKVTNKQIAQVFRKVKKYMQTDKHASDFICINISRCADNSVIEYKCRDIIQSRIGKNNVTLNDWLSEQGYPTANQDNKHKFKECRINWLTSLIEEFENK